MDRTPNAGKLWEPSEIETLDQMWHSESTLEEMVLALGRTAGAISAKLVERGFLYFSQKTMGYHLVGPWWTTKQIYNFDKKLKENYE
jgi:hypothetical protein